MFKLIFIALFYKLPIIETFYTRAFPNSFLKLLVSQIRIVLSRGRTYGNVTIYVGGTDYRGTNFVKNWITDAEFCNEEITEQLNLSVFFFVMECVSVLPVTMTGLSHISKVDNKHILD
jgi:hypothetical protein